MRRALPTLLALFGAVSAAGAAEDDGALWAVVGAEQPVTERTSVGLEVQTRFVDDLSELERVVVRPSLSYAFTDALTGTLGYDAHIVQLGGDRLEQRAWQQLAVGQRYGEVGAALRMRLEERVFENVSGAHVRLRVKLSLDHPAFRSGWSWLGSNEIFFALNGLSGGPDAGFGENRLFAGLGGPIGERLGWNAGYQMRYVENDGPDPIQHTLMLILRYRGVR